MANAKTTTPMYGSDVPMPERRPLDETVRLGKEIYDRDIRRLVEPDHVGEIVAIDVDTGLWAMGENAAVAAKRLRAKRPEAANVLAEKVGYRALRSFGVGSLRRTDRSREESMPGMKQW